MTDSVANFVISLIEKKGKLPKEYDLNTFNYIDTGYIDSIGIIKFILDIESKYDIEILDSDIESLDFRILGGVINIITKKITEKD